MTTNQGMWAERPSRGVGSERDSRKRAEEPWGEVLFAREGAHSPR